MGLRDTGCLKCRFTVTPRGVVGFAWRSLIEGLGERFGVQCPVCREVIPAFQSLCPGCKVTLTVGRVVDETIGPTRERVVQIIAPTPRKVSVFRWAYLLTSAVVFGSVFSVLPDSVGMDTILSALVSVFYLMLFLVVFVWLVPRPTIVAINRRAPKRIKLALLLNFLTCFILLDMVVKEWWARAAMLAVIFAAIAVGTWLFWKVLWPMLEGGAPSGVKPFDPQAPQGRTVETE